MSTWSQEFDEALVDSPWMPITASGSMSTASPQAPSSHFILKCARHPSRPGYIVLLTDLSSVYMEELTAPSVPSRTREVARLPRRDKSGKKKGPGEKDTEGVEEDMDDIVKQSEAALHNVQGLCAGGGKGDDEVEATVDLHDYHDGVLTMRTDSFSWIFYLTEIKGRQALEIVATQLVAPLATEKLDTGVHKPKNQRPPPIEMLQLLFTTFANENGSTRARATAEPNKAENKAQNRKRSPSPARSPPPRRGGRQRKKTATPESEILQSDSGRKEDENGNMQDEVQETPEYTSPPPPPKLATRAAKSSEERQTSSPEVTSDRNHATSRANADRSHSKAAASSAANSASPAKPAASPDEAADEGEAELATSQAASQAKSQTKRQREEAEEAELERKAEDMKRKMAGGGGGGVLGRRRLRR